MNPHLLASLLLLSSFADTLLAQERNPQDEKPVCTAAVSAHADPPIIFLTHVIGENGATYDETDLLIPEAIPLGVIATDPDQVFLECLFDCQARDTEGPWTAIWSFQQPDLGFFVAADGSRVSGVFDADHVVFLPARDLECGETREGQILATVIDPCGFGTDSDMEVEFNVTIERTQSGTISKFDVEVVPGDVTPGDPVGDECKPGTTGCCTLVGDGAFPDAPIIADLPNGEYPKHGMCVNELRPFNATGIDTDLAFIECGEPPCPSTFAQGGFCDVVEFQWMVVSGPGEFLYASGGIANGKTAIFRSDQPGEVTIQLIVDDPCTSYCGDDDPVPIMKTFNVYDLRFIDSANTALPLIENPPSGAQDEGLRVSKVTIGRKMNGCGGQTPTFAGPVPSPPDPDTFRIEFETPQGQATMLNYTVKVSINRAFDDMEYDVAAYEKDFTPTNQMNLFRTLEHLRLVSNARPQNQTALPPNSQYDDEACGDQSILVKLGDWVTATLSVDDGGDSKPICSIELPVGRPWGEPASVERSILEGKVHWSAMLASFDTQHTWHGGWNDAAEFEVSRASEDWAQAGIRLELTQVKEDGPFFNAFFMKETGPAHQNGTLRVDVILDGGTQQTIFVSVLATDTRLQVVEKTRTAIETQYSNTDLVDIYGHGIPGETGWLLVVDRGEPTVMGITDYGTTQLNNEFIDAPQNFSDLLLSYMEGDMAGINLKNVLGLGQRTIDVIVVPRWHIFTLNSIGKTGTSELGNDPLSGGPGLFYTVFLSEQAGNGWDGTFPMTFGHEIGHFLLDDGDGIHHGSAQNLLHADWVPFESPLKRKRLTTAQANQARQRAILAPVCIQIPEKDDC